MDPERASSPAPPLPPVMHSPAPETAEAGTRRWTVLVGIGIPVALGLATLYLFNPANHAFYPFCLFYRTTGLMCPGCGGLRSVHQLLHGNFAAAFRLNALVVLSLPLLAWLALRALLSIAGVPIAPLKVRRWWVLFGLAAMVAFGVLRNL